MADLTVQHTIRGIPKNVDKALRAHSEKEGRSLNQTAVEALKRGLGVGDEQARRHDLDKLAGTWEEDPEFDRALEAQDKVDRDLWE